MSSLRDLLKALPDWTPNILKEGIVREKEEQTTIRLRGVGWTRRSKEQSKKRRKMAKRSRRINRLRRG